MAQIECLSASGDELGKAVANKSNRQDQEASPSGGKKRTLFYTSRRKVIQLECECVSAT